jgi:hypothetical protein
MVQSCWMMSNARELKLCLLTVPDNLLDHITAVMLKMPVLSVNMVCLNEQFTCTTFTITACVITMDYDIVLNWTFNIPLLYIARPGIVTLLLSIPVYVIGVQNEQNLSPIVRVQCHVYEESTRNWVTQAQECVNYCKPLRSSITCMPDQQICIPYNMHAYHAL